MVCAILAVGSAAVWLFASPLYTEGVLANPLAWEAAEWPVRPWTLWTAAWIYQSAGYLVAHLLALGVLAFLGALLGAGMPEALALLVAWPLSALLLLLWPEVSAYSGLSGPIHAAALVLWAYLAMNSIAKPLSFVIFIAAAIKLLTEHAWSQPLSFDPSWGFNVNYAAHLTGAACGAACGLAAHAIARARR
jgi:hypothetical protein